MQVREGGGEITIDSDDDTRVAYTGPLAVLVDRMSASASEIVAGALQNYGRAIIVGDSSTHGKGTVQTLLEMKNFSRELGDSPIKTGAAKITIQKFYLPNGSSTQLRGVVPDISLPSVDDYLPIGESSLPHALVWDRISKAPRFDGAPLDPRILAAAAPGQPRPPGAARGIRLPEQDRGLVQGPRGGEVRIPLNLEERRKQKNWQDDAFKKEIVAERDLLAKGDYAVTEFRLGAAAAEDEGPATTTTDDGDPTRTTPPSAPDEDASRPSARWTCTCAKPSAS